MIKINSYSAKGIKSGQIALPKEFEEKPNLVLLAQAIRVFEAFNHPGLAKAKTRGEINRTKKKWYKQKGTGGARHGARSAPIFVGGGVAHGPKNVERKLKLSQRMRRKALKIALSIKARKGEIVAVTGLSELKKTKDAQIMLNKITSIIKEKTSKFITVVFTKETVGAKKALKNIKNVNAVIFDTLNVLDVYKGGTILFDKAIFRSKKEAKK